MGSPVKWGVLQAEVRCPENVYGRGYLTLRESLK